MKLTDEDLRRLYERLIRQQPYAGQVCPAEHVLVAYDAGILPQDQHQRVGEHLAACSLCRKDVTELTRAGEWFRANESQILAGLAHKGTLAGVQPWATCPSVQLLYGYLEGDVPDIAGGRILTTQIEQHLEKCPNCATIAHEYRAAAGPSVSMLDLAEKASQAVRDRLRAFLDDLLRTTRAQGVPEFVRAAPGYRGERGYRSTDAPSVTAPVVGPNKKILVDDQGQPRLCRFGIVEASIQKDGFVTVDLSVADREYHARPDQHYVISLSILAKDLRLALPDTSIDEQGRATLTGMLPEGVHIESVPPGALHVTVRKVSSAASPEGEHEVPP